MVPTSVFKLNRMRKRHHSQWGEDGLLEYLLSRLPTRDLHLVEFGAWDGKHLSNGFHLIEKLGYSAVLIEVDPERFKDLENNMRPYKCVCINEMVGFDGKSNLDSILAKTDIPMDFDLLSVDIDGNDYQVWKALVIYRPKIVIIEINSSIVPGIMSINDPNHPFELFVSGSSISAMVSLARTKGYKLVANVGCNAIFVLEEYYNIYHSKELSEFEIFTFEALDFKSLRLKQKLQTLSFAIARPNLISRISSRIKFLRKN